MTNHVPSQPDDAELARLLARRASRRLDDLGRDQLVVRVRLATAARGGSSGSRWRRWLLPVATATTVVLVAVVVASSPLSPGAGTATNSPTSSRTSSPTIGPTADASQSPGTTVTPATPDPFAIDGVLSLDQLQAVITQARVDGVQRPVIADVDLDRDAIKGEYGALCLADAPCAVGRLIGITPSLDVVADAELRDYLRAADPSRIAGPLALRVASSAPELLGAVQVNPTGSLNIKGDLLWPASASAVSPAESGLVGQAVVVHGFLDWSGPVPCAAPLPPTPPPGGPFNSCPWGWIASQPTEATSVPADAIKVQWEAYNDFVPDGSQAGPSGYPPFEGTFVLRLVADPRPDCDPCRGWKVVGRLDEATADTNHVLTTEELVRCARGWEVVARVEP